ncbi:uncharacterized protein LOC121377971 [Gigantopelta aegis]|uniref:uncharacterized protein LOC121377971 n=1 Tax=Gigantopelta aegis TaxID=1735272 RepID=UPI001B887CA5|nr:uncharacterized protein LOC121377971 [Gigantopelta aegis]
MIAKSILHCGRQCIGLQGKVENVLDEAINPGNFLAMLKLLGESDPVLQHLQEGSKSKGQYLSPRIQNEVIEIMGGIVRSTILSDICQAKFYTIMVDEVECHHTEQMPLCICFIEYDGNIREEFMEFITLNRITGAYIAAEILSWLEKVHLDTADMSSQCYDWASNMSSEKVGIQKRIRDSAPMAVDEVKHTYQDIRDNVDSHFDRWFTHATRMADKVDVGPSLPRIAKRQQHRSNAPVPECDCSDRCMCAVKGYHIRNTEIPLLDHIIVELDTRFSGLARNCARLIGLVPSVLCEKADLDVSDAVQQYEDGLPSSELIPEEMIRWRAHYMDMDRNDRPQSCSRAIKECDAKLYPNLHVLLQIVCTLPVTSCECEISCSVLRRLNTYMRASMGQERLSSLALLHIHYGHKIDLEQVVNMFASLHPRKLELQNLIFQVLVSELRVRRLEIVFMQPIFMLVNPVTLSTDVNGGGGVTTGDDNARAHRARIVSAHVQQRNSNRMP